MEYTGLAGQLTPEEFVREREAMLDEMFPQSELMPGERQYQCLAS